MAKHSNRDIALRENYDTTEEAYNSFYLPIDRKVSVKVKVEGPEIQNKAIFNVDIENINKTSIIL